MIKELLCLDIKMEAGDYNVTKTLAEYEQNKVKSIEILLSTQLDILSKMKYGFALILGFF